MKKIYYKPVCHIVDFTTTASLLAVSLPAGDGGSTDESLVKGSSEIWGDESYWDSSFED